MKDYWLLIRPRIVAMVLFAMGVAIFTAGESIPPWPMVVHALLGTGLVIVGAVVLNQRLEFRGDAMMSRTAMRPLPSGRMTNRQVSTLGFAATAIGFICLAVFGNVQLLCLAAVSWVLYVWIYTPLKSRSAWQTLVGAVAGAMPMLLGAAAVDATFTPMAWTLFAIVFLWQFPHSMAIAWLYREEFAAGGVKLATVTDSTGRTAGLIATTAAIILLMVGLVPSMLREIDWYYGVCALLLGHGYMFASMWFLRRRSEKSARLLLRVSVFYLPLLFLALLFT